MRGRAIVLTLALAALAGGVGAPLRAQDAPPVASPILTVDPERLFAESQFGRASLARLEAEQATLVAENKRLEAALEAEEKALTDRRPGLPADEFRALADAFDKKAEEIRAARVAKSRSLNTLRDDDRQKFLEAIVPILGELMGEMGALAILDKTTVFLSFERVDITDQAIARIDAVLDETLLPKVQPDPTP